MLSLAYASLVFRSSAPSSRWGLYAVARIRELDAVRLTPARVLIFNQADPRLVRSWESLDSTRQHYYSLTD
jgi:hypothetical protein